MQSHPSIFPLYNPSSVDVIVFWEIPSQARAGHILIPGVTFGAGHAALKEIIEDAEGAKVKRSMYAETQREKEEILDAIRASEWNAEMNPIVIDQQHGRTVKHEFSQGCVKCDEFASHTLIFLFTGLLLCKRRSRCEISRCHTHHATF